VPFCTWLLIGYFKSIPYELEECALVDGATRLQILRRITLPARGARADLGRHFFLHAVLERVHLRARLIQSSANKTVPVAILTELVSGDVYQLGRADGRVPCSARCRSRYSTRCSSDYYVSSLTGAVKE